MIEYLKICRPEHWLKNIFIVFGHAAAVVLILKGQVHGGLVVKAFLSLLPACLAASANYLLNEILDAPFDAQHPTKRHRGIPAGKVRVSILWWMVLALAAGSFALAWLCGFNTGYQLSLALLLLSGIVYNVRPLRLKDRAFLDVIAESFNNPIRLWLGFYALVDTRYVTPLSIVLAWWFFGALLMTGKRYAEFRFIGDAGVSGRYRRSFQTYTETTLIMAMMAYANLFCFATGVAMAVYEPLNNLIFAFPLIVAVVLAYFRHAMNPASVQLEPEKLMQNPWVLAGTAITTVAVISLLASPENLARKLHLLGPLEWAF
jgi:4-hydroxybenzoate polyprenyltransferase